MASSLVAETLPAMYGNATAAMEVSSTSMNVANITAMAMTHGLVSGLETVTAPAVSALAANSLLPY